MSIFISIVGAAFFFFAVKLWKGAGKAGEGAANFGAKIGLRYLAVMMIIFGLVMFAGGVIVHFIN